MMKKHHSLLRITSLLITSLIVMQFCAVNSYAMGSAQESICVGYYQMPGYHQVDENGIRSGYGYDLLQELRPYTGWSYEYVGYAEDYGLEEMLQMLQQGQIDVLTAVTKTEALEEAFDFTTEAIGTCKVLITVKQGNNTYSASDFSNWDGIVVGLLAGSSINASFEDYVQGKGIRCEVQYYDTVAQQEQALQSGAVDALATTSLKKLQNEWIIDEISTAPFYAITRKGNGALLTELNAAIRQLNSFEPDFTGALYKKYYAGTDKDSIDYTTEEWDYIQSCIADGTVITAAISPDRNPGSYNENGEMKGYLCDLQKLIFDRTGLNLKITPCSTVEEYRALLESGSVDLCCDMAYDYNTAEANGYIVTVPYYTGSIAKVSQDFSGKISTVALKRNSYVTNKVLPLLDSSARVLYLDTMEDCLDAVRNGTADATYLYTMEAQKAIYEDVTNQLNCVTLPGLEVQFCIAVKGSAYSLLPSILNKAVLSLTENDVAGAINPYTTYSMTATGLLELLYRNPVISVILVLVLAALVAAICIVLILRRQNRREKESNAALADAYRVAEEASKSKGTFLSNMSHEIRTPLNAIIGYLSLAKGSGGNLEKIEHYIDNSEVASRHLLQIINDILDMSSIENGRLKIAHEEFDLKQEIADITSIFYQNATAKGIRFETHVTALTDEWLVGDQLRLNQILMNLLSNSLKFTPKDGLVKLEIEQMSQQENQNKAYIRFAVSDTGIGMSQEYMTRLFQPFEQEQASTARKYGGSGLGLSITHNLVRMMGGTITVDSKQNIGTTFTVMMYFDRCENHEIDVPQQKEYSHVHVLVVDDQENECNYVKTMLGRWGVKADTVTSGEKALTRIKGRFGTDYSYDLCILDWNMPGMNGVELAKQIREEFGDKMPIIVATAYDVTELEEEAKSAGVNRVIAKPLFQSTIFDILVSTFGKYNPEAEKKISKAIDLSGVHVLLAEDNAMNMEIAVTILEKVGVVVDQAANGQQAYDRFVASAPGTYDMIFMDVQMPDVDGYEATKMIRRSTHSEATEIPIIAMTANAFAEDVAEALSNGMNAHIAKPLDYDKLFQMMQKFSKSVKQLPQGLHILLCEDHPLNAEIAKRLLAEKQEEVTWVQNGKQGVDAFIASPKNFFDVILMDIRMPVMNGLDAASAIRALERIDAKTVPIIAMTANNDAEDVRETEAAGMNAHLSKTFEPKQLYAAIAECLRNR